MHQETHRFFEGIGFAAIVGTVLGWVPMAVSVLAGIYYLIRIYESKTVQEWVSRFKAK